LRSRPRAGAAIRCGSTGRLDILGINQLGRALYAPVFDDPRRSANMARFNFLDPRSADFYPDWDDAADISVALLRTEAGRDPYDRGLTDLVGELSTRSEAFRTRWAAHDVRLHRTGVKHFRHPAVGRLDLTFDAMEIPTDRGLTMTCYTAEPGSASDENLKLLANWAATLEQDAAAHDDTSEHHFTLTVPRAGGAGALYARMVWSTNRSTTTTASA